MHLGPLSHRIGQPPDLRLLSAPHHPTPTPSPKPFFSTAVLNNFLLERGSHWQLLTERGSQALQRLDQLLHATISSNVTSDNNAYCLASSPEPSLWAPSSLAAPASAWPAACWDPSIRCSSATLAIAAATAVCREGSGEGRVKWKRPKQSALQSNSTDLGLLTSTSKVQGYWPALPPLLLARPSGAGTT